MKHTTLILSILFFVLINASAQSTWKSPEYKATTYRKVIVLAKLSDDIARRQFEDATVKALQAKGIEAIPAYSNITAADLASEEALIAKADTLEADALLVYNITGKDAVYTNTPSVGVSVGVPVKIGIFRGFIGSNLPLAGGTKATPVINATATFYNRSSKDMQWSCPLTGKQKKGNDKLAQDFANTTIKAMLKDRLFVQ